MFRKPVSPLIPTFTFSLVVLQSLKWRESISGSLFNFLDPLVLGDGEKSGAHPLKWWWGLDKPRGYYLVTLLEEMKTAAQKL